MNMRRMHRGTLLAAVLCAAVWMNALPAAADDGMVVHILSVDDSNFPAVTAVVSVEAVGRPVETLDASAITVTDNGSPVIVRAVTRVQDARIPTTVVVTLDTSGSMLGANLASAKAALAGLVLRLTPTDSVALVSFADRAEVILAPTNDKSGVGVAVSALQAGGNTALYGAVSESARLAGTSGTTRRLVILLTDGEEFGNVSGVSREASLENAAQSGAIFYVIGLGIGADREYLTQLAERTGGRYLDAPATADIERGYAAIEETLRSQFVLSLESEALPSPLTREITVTVVSEGLEGSDSYAFVSSRRLPTPVPPTPTSIPATQAADMPGGSIADSPAESSGSMPLWPFVALTAIAAIGIVAVGVRSRRRTEPDLIRTDLEELATDFRVEVPEVVEAVPVGWLVLERPQSAIEVSGSFAIPQEPVLIGSSDECRLQLPQADGIAPLHARIWWKDGRVMFHDLGHGTTTVNGNSVRWASLSEGDVLTVGPYTFHFSAKLPAHPASLPMR